MNKGDLINKIADDVGVSKVLAKSMLESYTSAVSKSLSGGERVSIPGFGTFSVARRSARRGRNPRTGQEIKIPARNVVRFKAGAELSIKVN